MASFRAGTSACLVTPTASHAMVGLTSAPLVTQQRRRSTRSWQSLLVVTRAQIDTELWLGSASLAKETVTRALPHRLCARAAKESKIEIICGDQPASPSVPMASTRTR